MKVRPNFCIALVTVVLATLGSLSPEQVQGADTPNPGNGSTIDPIKGGLPSTLMGVTAPDFKLSQAGQLQNLFSECVDVGNSVAQILAVTTSKGKSGPVGPDGCGLNDAVPATLRFDSCDAFKVGGVFKPDGLDKTIAMLQGIGSTDECKKTKLDALSKQVSCFNTKTQQFRSQMAAYQSTFDQNFQKMIEDYEKIQSVQGDRVYQSKIIAERLGGGDPTKPTGLVGLLAQTNDLVQKLSGQIKGAGDALTQLNVDKASFETQKLSQIAAKANQCFTYEPAECTVNGQITACRCTPNGPPVSARAIIECRTRDLRRIGKNGRYENDKSTQEGANAAQSGIGSILDKILLKSPVIDLNKTQNDAQRLAAVNQARTLLTAEEMDAKYGKFLEAYSVGGFNPRVVAFTAYQKCFDDAKAEVDRDQGLKNQQAGLVTRTTNLQKDFTDVVDAGRTQYRLNVQGMTAVPNSGTIPLDSCRETNTTPENQIKCMSDMQTYLRNQAAGTTAADSMTINIDSSIGDSNAAFTFTCKGLEGCIRSLQNSAKRVDQEKTKTEQFLKDYATRSRKGVDAFLAKTVSLYNQQSGNLKKQLDQLQSALRATGFPGALGYEQVPAEQLQGDPNHPGLYGKPNSVESLIAGKLSPPPLKIDPNSLGQLTEKANSYGSKLNDIKDMIRTVQQLKPECEKQDIASSVDSLRKDVDLFNSSGCSSNQKYCEQVSSTNKVQESLNNLSDVVADYGLPAFDSIRGDLEGLGGACSRTVATKTNNELLSQQTLATKIKAVKDSCAGNCNDLSESNLMDYPIPAGVGSLPPAEKTAFNDKLTAARDALNDLQNKRNNLSSGQYSSSTGPAPQICNSISDRIDKTKDAINRKKSLYDGGAGNAAGESFTPSSSGGKRR